MQFKHSSCLRSLNLTAIFLLITERLVDRWIIFFNSTSETQPYRYVSSSSFFVLFLFLRWINIIPQKKQQQQQQQTNKKTEKLHSANETTVWRAPGESWACLLPVLDFDWIHPASGCDDTDMWCFVEQVVFLTGVSPRTPPLEGTSLHRRNMSVERPRGDLEPVYDPFPITSELALTEVVTQTCAWQLCGAGRFSYGESPRTPPLEGTSLHRRNMSVESPWGILSLFTVSYTHLTLPTRRTV